MSQENVEISKRVFELLLDRPDIAAGIEAGLEYTDPDVVLESAIVGGAEGNTYHGHDGLRAWAADSDAAFEELRTVPEQFRDLDDRVLMLGRVFGRGRGKRGCGRVPDRLPDHPSRRQDRPRQGLSGLERSPRSRRAVGVSDVAGERGEVQARRRGVQPP